MEQNFLAAFRGFAGDLKGKYYSLAAITAAEQARLLEDNFLFKFGDRFVEAAGLNRDWPTARGVYHNKEKTLLIWVNDEDQLRIISMEQGSNINAVFTRLSKTCSKIEKHAKFSHSPQLGYITSRPSTLGTALRVTMLVQLASLRENRKEFQAIADRCLLSFRAVPGSSNQPHQHLYELSNRKRLGLSEVQIIQYMYDGVKAMIALDRNIANPYDTMCGKHLLLPEDLETFPAFPAGSRSLLAKNLTRDIWDKLKDNEDALKYPFKSLIFPGCQNVDAEIGVYAGSEDSYLAFDDLLLPIIRQYHGVNLSAPHESCMDPDQLELPEFSEDDKRFIMHCEIRISRNFARVPFGPQISAD